MKHRYSEAHKLWLYDLSHDPDKMQDMKIVKGFIQFYVLDGLTAAHVQQDIIFHTVYGAENCKLAMDRLESALEGFALN